jgi:anthranilate/para-aminobenzoate synthase component I
LRATFPPGSVTGAPKIRAMQIIETLESRPRGAYCGALGMLGPSGDLMLSVGIRTATMEGAFDGNVFSGTLHYGTGGGITTRSDPAAELQETIVKARALCDVLRPSDAAADQAGPARHESTASTPCGGAADSP